MTLIQNILLNTLSAAFTVYSFFLFYDIIARKNQKFNHIIMLRADNRLIYAHVDICRKPPDQSVSSFDAYSIGIMDFRYEMV